MRPHLVFKAAVSVVLVAEISLLWGIMYMVLQEYDPSHIETIGFSMIILAVALGSATFLWSLYQLLKWKPS